ncbi:hypothetical protein [Scrofimicrobium canadense]|nr:hypothetical protein [Scrofimicrobium canadense]
MYGWIFRHLPGPKWLKVIEALLLILVIIWALFTYVYPPIHEHFNQVTVG